MMASRRIRRTASPANEPLPLRGVRNGADRVSKLSADLRALVCTFLDLVDHYKAFARCCRSWHAVVDRRDSFPQKLCLPASLFVPPAPLSSNVDRKFRNVSSPGQVVLARLLSLLAARLLELRVDLWPKEEILEERVNLWSKGETLQKRESSSTAHSRQEHRLYHCAFDELMRGLTKLSALRHLTLQCRLCTADGYRPMWPNSIVPVLDSLSVVHLEGVRASTACWKRLFTRRGLQHLTLVSCYTNALHMSSGRASGSKHQAVCRAQELTFDASGQLKQMFAKLLSQGKLSAPDLHTLRIVNDTWPYQVTDRDIQLAWSRLPLLTTFEMDLGRLAHAPFALLSCLRTLVLNAHTILLDGSLCSSLVSLPSRLYHLDVRLYVLTNAPQLSECVESHCDSVARLASAIAIPLITVLVRRWLPDAPLAIADNLAYAIKRSLQSILSRSSSNVDVECLTSATAVVLSLRQ